jgi:hypothetical protein
LSEMESGGKMSIGSGWATSITKRATSKSFKRT